MPTATGLAVERAQVVQVYGSVPLPHINANALSRLFVLVKVLAALAVFL